MRRALLGAALLPVIAHWGPASGPAQAQDARPSLKDSFRLGSGGGVLCQAQTQGGNPALKGMFDRAWSIACRDAARPIGSVYQLRDSSEGALARVAAVRSGVAGCTPAPKTTLDDVAGEIAVSDCTLASGAVAYRIYHVATGGTVLIAEGLAGYDSALRLALRTVAADRQVTGEVSVATTGVADSVAFARVLAAALDPDQALAEGYRRNNSGAYAEAAEFFDTLQQRSESSSDRQEPPGRRGEYLINRALQKSNLGAFAEADALFAEAAREPFQDRVQSRLRRNFLAIHALNQGDQAGAIAALDMPVAAANGAMTADNDVIAISPALAAEINADLPTARRLGITSSTSLTGEERAALLDAQALQLRGTVQRLRNDNRNARATLQRALDNAVAVRDGRVTSIYRLRAQTMAEIALAFEAEGEPANAERMLREALALLAANYPETAAMNGARARLAAFLVRAGKQEEALALYRAVVASVTANRETLTGVSNQIQPYFDLLVERLPGEPSLAADLFLAGQILMRPGVADTQAILARQLSEGDDEAARLFRQSVTLSRDIERARIEAARLAQVQSPDADLRAQADAVARDLAALESEQATTLALLSQYPQFRAVAAEALSVETLQKALRPGEAYLKLAVTGNGVYAVYADAASVTGYRVPLSPAELESAVTRLRDSISIVENGQLLTYPFDVATSRALHDALFAPVAGRMSGVSHLIFEPDGAMLKLPVNLLIAEQAGVDAYQARLNQPDNDEFDFRGIEWLGRNRSISTSVSARGFVDTRRARRSAAQRAYIGLGENAPPPDSRAEAQCQWPLGDWQRPIPARELMVAANSFGGSTATLLTRERFTDSAIAAAPDLDQYRILHFATHGLVTPPRPECPARPALLTSFGDGASDGLLSFREIFDLKLDADLVILSACDTAGTASIAATREAGVLRGGGSALDGLVRAFVGAGSRSVIASHWPAPDDFDATEQLISGLFTASPGMSTGDAMRQAQLRLMDSATTSHPYYWSAFAIIGDGGQSLFSAGGNGG